MIFFFQREKSHSMFTAYLNMTNGKPFWKKKLSLPKVVTAVFAGSWVHIIWLEYYVRTECCNILTNMLHFCGFLCKTLQDALNVTDGISIINASKLFKPFTGGKS